MDRKDKIAGGLVGLVVGDAMGVPVEFVSREALKKDPVTGMRGYGTYNQPAGTWSDDSSMTLATLYSIRMCGHIDVENIAVQFSEWLYGGEFTPYGKVFDVGNTTRIALNRYSAGLSVYECGCKDNNSNGNGSLMRMYPVAILHGDVNAVSAITHAHERSMLGCRIYSVIIQALLLGWPLDECIAMALYKNKNNDEIDKYCRLRHIEDFVETDISSTGYVVSTLEAALWCAATTDNYRDCVLKAVNLGDDTDTVAAVAGSIAGTMYGYEAIPAEWIKTLAKYEDVVGYAKSFAAWA